MIIEITLHYFSLQGHFYSPALPGKIGSACIFSNVERGFVCQEFHFKDFFSDCCQAFPPFT